MEHGAIYTGKQLFHRQFLGFMYINRKTQSYIVEEMANAIFSR